MEPQNDTSDDDRLDVLAAIPFADVAGADDGIVLEEDQIFVVDGLTYERPLEREGVPRIEVVAHDPGFIDVGGGRGQICREYGRATIGLDDDDLMVHRVPAGSHDAD